jgi:hypothetical protein
MTTDPFILTATAAIEQLLSLLSEAGAYLEEGETLAALGTLVLFEEQADARLFGSCGFRRGGDHDWLTSS